MEDFINKKTTEIKKPARKIDEKEQDISLSPVTHSIMRRKVDPRSIAKQLNIKIEGTHHGDVRTD